MEFKVIADKLLNRGIKSTLLTTDTSIIFGQKRVGKSTLSSCACDLYASYGYTCLSNYPIANSLALPMKEEYNKKDGRYYMKVDKDFLYETDLRNCAIFIDEGANYWPARGYSTDWTYRDTEFFTLSAKRHIKLFINVQYIDLLDLNVKRASDTYWFLTRNRYFKSITNVAVSEVVTLPVANTSAVIMSKSIKDAYAVNYQVCEIPIKDSHFYRPMYYDKFDTSFDYKVYDTALGSVDDLTNWNDIIDFSYSAEKGTESP